MSVSTIDASALHAVKQRQQVMWASGDFHAVATLIQPVAEALCEAMGCRRMALRVVNIREELAPWYRRLGYRETGATVPFDDPRAKLPCFFVEMEKPLAS